MNSTTSSTMFWCAVILILAGIAAHDPALRVAVFVAAAASAATPVILGGGRSRLAGLVVAAAAGVLAARSYPEFCRHLKRFGKNVETKANAGAAETQRELSKDR